MEDLDRMADVMKVPHKPANELGYLNNKPLAFKNEPARHKLLDVMGDLALIGRPLKGRIVATRPGHTINTQLSKKIRQLKLLVSIVPCDDGTTVGESVRIAADTFDRRHLSVVDVHQRRILYRCPNFSIYRSNAGCFRIPVVDVCDNVVERTAKAFALVGKQLELVIL